MLQLKQELTLPAVGLTGFETPLTEDETAIQDAVHHFAKNVLRPVGQELGYRQLRCPVARQLRWPVDGGDCRCQLAIVVAPLWSSVGN
jgi:hypothetical protein